MYESDIIIHLTSTDTTISNDALEEHMFEVLEAVEQHASDPVEGVVVAVDFTRRDIELAFSLSHETQSEAQRIIADVLSLIEVHTSVSFGATDSAVRGQAGDKRSFALCQ